jgi:hypothetical protein
MHIRIILLTLAFSFVGVSVRAQSLQPYIVGEGGGWFGDGGGTGMLAVGFGVLTPQNFGFEIEVSAVPGLDFGDTGDPRIAIFPPIVVNSTGRVVALQTHVIGILPGGGTRFRAFVIAGGGIADLERRIRISGDFLPPVFTPTLPDFPILLPSPFDLDRRESDSVLVLSAGTGFEYALTPKLGLGTSLRYQRLFTDPADLDSVRVAARLVWRF